MALLGANNDVGGGGDGVTKGKWRFLKLAVEVVMPRTNPKEKKRSAIGSGST